jgi:hypothetical protein
MGIPEGYTTSFVWEGDDADEYYDSIAPDPDEDEAVRDIHLAHEVPPSDEDTAGFAARVSNTRVDLIQRIKDGIPPTDYLPASDGMLIRGKRHQIAAPRKEGKSLSMIESGARAGEPRGL